jgi:hypothetical protein
MSPAGASCDHEEHISWARAVAPRLDLPPVRGCPDHDFRGCVRDYEGGSDGRTATPSRCVGILQIRVKLPTSQASLVIKREARHLGLPPNVLKTDRELSKTEHWKTEHHSRLHSQGLLEYNYCRGQNLGGLRAQVSGLLLQNWSSTRGTLSFVLSALSPQEYTLT